VLSAQPSLDTGQIRRNQMKLAMSVGENNHYRFDGIHARHFVQTGEEAKLPKRLVRNAIEGIRTQASAAIEQIEGTLPEGFPEEIHASIKAAVTQRLRSLELTEAK
jgi:serine/threonine-protein kinase HipA